MLGSQENIKKNLFREWNNTTHFSSVFLIFLLMVLWISKSNIVPDNSKQVAFKGFSGPLCPWAGISWTFHSLLVMSLDCLSDLAIFHLLHPAARCSQFNSVQTDSMPVMNCLPCVLGILKSSRCGSCPLRMCDLSIGMTDMGSPLYYNVFCSLVEVWNITVRTQKGC